MKQWKIPPYRRRSELGRRIDGPTGWKSYKAAVTLIKEGYKNVMWYRGGTAEWEANGLTMEK